MENIPSMAANPLPTHATPFVGRTDELSQLAALLHDPTCRLLTLTGPGGIGKTRLAVELTRLVSCGDSIESPLPMTAFPDGCYFVPLQPLTSPGAVLPAIADALHFTFRGELDPKQQLLGYLEGKHLLLVLDNFEHLSESADLLPELLERAPGLKLLVTSRERLRLQEECVFDVGGLTFPTNAYVPEWDDFSAVKLFVQCARRAGYTPADGDFPPILRICQIVEGIPLAIELAAAWVRVMPCADIARAVEASLDILTSTMRNIPDKHRSMRVSFDHSWALLTSDEQAVFRKLSVFRGGFIREGAEQVAGATLATLALLVDKSLVQVNASGRFDLHELLRQYAAEKLLDAGEESTTVQRHADYYLHLAEQAEAHNFGREQVTWYDRLEAELDNLRVALARLVEDEQGLRLAGALGWFFSERAHWLEGLDWLEQMLAANPDAPASLRAKVLHSAGALASLQGDAQQGRTHCRQALTLARATNDRWNIAWSLCHLYLNGRNDLETVGYLEESLALFRELEDRMGISHTLVRLSWTGIFGPTGYPYARRLLEEAATYAHEAGDKIILGWVNENLGLVSWFQDHDLQRARAYFENSLSYFREAHFPFPDPLIYLADVERAMGNLAHAQTLYEESLNFHYGKSGPNNLAVPRILAGLAGIARARGQFERAAAILGYVDSALSRVEVHDARDHITFYTDVAAVRAQLDETAFAELWAAGKAMSREQCVSYVMVTPASPTGQANESETAPSTTPSQPDSLNARELEVLRLVADGLSNREIAAQLFVTVNTVKWYLKEIFGKLNVANRAQAAARAQALGLLVER